MKLFFMPTSPYVRKVRVTAIETGLDSRIERVLALVVPEASAELLAENPLGKIPTLVTDGGETLFDSRVICEYLDSLHDGQRLFPAEGGSRWRALRWQALGDGILDAAVGVRYEVLRPEGERSQAWLAKQRAKITRSLAALGEETEALSSAPMTIGQIAIGCALAYLDFRGAVGEWRTSYAPIAAWHDSFSQRSSMKATVFADPS